MRSLINIVQFVFLTGLVSMLVAKIIKYLTKDEAEEKQFYTIDEVEAMRKRCYERMKQ